MDFQGREMLLHNFLLLQQGAGIGGIDCRARKRFDAPRPACQPGEHIPAPRSSLDSAPPPPPPNHSPTIVADIVTTWRIHKAEPGSYRTKKAQIK